MKSKKLTKREWFEAGWRWATGPSVDVNNCLFGIMLVAAAAALREIGCDGRGKAPMERGTRWFFYSQYCLERAGIPAGRK